MKTREEIESDIEQCREIIYQQQYTLRWFSLGIRIFCLGLVVSLIIFIVLSPLNIPILQPILLNVGYISAFLSVLAGIVILATYTTFETIRVSPVLLKDAKRALAKTLRHLTYYDEQAFKRLSPQDQYLHRLPTLIESYRSRADKYRWWFVVTQIITILLSATITSLAGGWLDKYIVLPWIIPVFSALISILTSITLFFKFREKGANLQQTADAMDLEHMACNLGIRQYKGMAKPDAVVLLAEQIEALRKEQQQRQQQLEQSSHAEQKAMKSEA